MLQRVKFKLNEFLSGKLMQGLLKIFLVLDKVNECLKELVKFLICDKTSTKVSRE